jgi:predicted nuclease of predicted toxin-antitoxin system
MALALYMDVHVPAAITNGLRQRGIDTLTSQDDGTRTAADHALMRRATELHRVMVSCDEDFLRIAATWQASELAFVGLVSLTSGGVRIGQVIDDIELICQCMAPEEIRNQIVFVPL